MTLNSILFMQGLRHWANNSKAFCRLKYDVWWLIPFPNVCALTSETYNNDEFWKSLYKQHTEFCTVSSYSTLRKFLYCVCSINIFTNKIMLVKTSKRLWTAWAGGSGQCSSTMPLVHKHSIYELNHIYKLHVDTESHSLYFRTSFLYAYI